MKTIVQTANVEGETIPFKRSDSVLVCRVQPAARCAFGLAGSMVCCLAQRVKPDALKHREEIIRGRFLPAGRRR